MLTEILLAIIIFMLIGGWERSIHNHNEILDYLDVLGTMLGEREEK